MGKLSVAPDAFELTARPKDEVNHVAIRNVYL